MPEANHAGATRPERLRRLQASFAEAGIPVRFDLVPNMAHDGMKALPRVQDFFANALADRRGRGAVTAA